MRVGGQVILGKVTQSGESHAKEKSDCFGESEIGKKSTHGAEIVVSSWLVFSSLRVSNTGEIR